MKSPLRPLWVLLSVLVALAVGPLVFSQAQAPGGAAAPGRGGGAGGRGGGGIPNATPMQTALVQSLASKLSAQSQAATAAETALVAASLTLPRNDADIRSKADALATAELALANARADGFAEIQSSANRFSADQKDAATQQISSAGGRGGFSQPEPINWDDHTGFVSIFDGTLNGWDGNRDLWKIQDGAIFADTTTGSFGTTYLIRQGVTVKDFDLKMLLKMGGNINSGIQYRGWTTAGRGGGTGVAGYQYDLDAANRYTGDLYEQATGRGIVTYPGEVVETLPPLLPGASRRHVLLAEIGNEPVSTFVKPLGEWNELEIIAHGNTLTHIMNGHITAVTIDDDPDMRSFEGILAIEVEGQGQVWAKDIWLRNLDDTLDRTAAAQ